MGRELIMPRTNFDLPWLLQAAGYLAEKTAWEELVTQFQEKYDILRFFTISEVLLLHDLAASFQYLMLSRRFALLFQCGEDTVTYMCKHVKQLVTNARPSMVWHCASTIFLVSLHLTTVKSCTNAAAYAQMYNFLLRLLFKCGFYSRAAYMSNVLSLQNPSMQSGTVCTVKVKADFVKVTRRFQKVNIHFGMQKAIEFSPTWMILCPHFQAVASFLVWFLCNLSLEKVRLLFEVGFLSNATFIHDFMVSF